MEDLNFVNMGDEKFFDSILLSIKQVRKFYPESHFYLYDWGFNHQQLERLSVEGQNVVLVDWKDKFREVSSVRDTDWHKVLVEVESFQDINGITMLKRMIKKYLLHDKEMSASTSERAAQHKIKEYLLAQKPFCLLDCAQRCRGKMVFLDGDVFLVDRIDEVFTDEFDIGVTLRRKHEIRRGKNRCQVLNSGVIFFNGFSEKTIAFLKYWIAAMERTHEYLIEQTSLTRLIEKENTDIFCDYYMTAIVQMNGLSVIVKTFH